MAKSVILLFSGLSAIAIAGQALSDSPSTYQIGKDRPRKSCRRAAPWVSGISSDLPAQSWCSTNFPMPTVTVTLTTTETSTAPTGQATSTVSTETVTAPTQNITSTVAIETLTNTKNTDTTTVTGASSTVTDFTTSFVLSTNLLTVTALATTTSTETETETSTTTIRSAVPVKRTDLHYDTVFLDEFLSQKTCLIGQACHCYGTTHTRTVTRTATETAISTATVTTTPSTTENVTATATSTPSATDDVTATVTESVDATATATATETDTITSTVITTDATAVVTTTTSTVTETTTTTTTSVVTATFTPPPSCNPADASTGQQGAGGCSDDCYCDPDADGVNDYCNPPSPCGSPCTQDADCPIDQFCVTGPAIFCGSPAVCAPATGCTSTMNSAVRLSIAGLGDVDLPPGLNNHVDSSRVNGSSVA